MPFVQGFDSSEILPENLRVAINRAALTNAAERNGLVSRAFYVVVNHVDNQRRPEFLGKNNPKMFSYAESAGELVTTQWASLRGAAANWIDPDDLDYELDLLLHEEECDLDRNAVLGVESAGFRTIWKRESTSQI